MTKKNIQDPHAKREAEKYTFPIPSREYILDHLKGLGTPVTITHLFKALHLTADIEQDALRRRLRAMVRDAQLHINRKNEYGLIDKLSLIDGHIIGHKDGYGFLTSEARDNDIFLSEREMRKVFHGDRVLVRIKGSDRRGRTMGAIVKILEHNTREVVGRFFREGGASFVIPDHQRLNHDILILPKDCQGVSVGQIVTVEIISQPSKRGHPTGRIKEVLGQHLAPGMEVDIALRSHSIPHQWPDDVEAEIARLKTTVSKKDKQDRVDLRDMNFVTIDGKDAKDFDDAVYCQQGAKGGWQLWVAIADVSHYVKPGTALDREAALRANSVYFPTRVVPMLPEVLSNGLCSLKPKVDRLCMVCEMSLSKTGELRQYRFYKAVMRSKARLTYQEVANFLTSKHKKLPKKHQFLAGHLLDLHELFQILLQLRKKRGAIDFDIPESTIIFDNDSKIADIVAVQRNDAHRMIEECMLLANVCAAQLLQKRNMPSLYRIHEGPQQEKLEDVRKFLAELGLRLGGGEQPQPANYARLLDKVKARPDFMLIQTVLLRSLSQAVYAGKNCGHFGLAYDAYAHFTSPIRRYSDLLVHRAIWHLLLGKRGSTFQYNADDIASLAKQCSMAERRADDATRDVLDWLKCEYMQDKLGQEFTGTVSGVTAFGLFVTLDDIYIDGLIHVTSLKNDYYQYDAAHHRLHGQVTGVDYCLGDSLKIMVARVNLDDRKIDFELVNGLKKISKRRRSSQKKSHKKKSVAKRQVRR